jgi:PIN domain nuclease of toxin-antitoxin system
VYFVADTHSFLWYLSDSPKLSNNARKIFDIADRGKVVIVLPAIVVLECLDVIEKKKVGIKFVNILSKISQASNFTLADVNWGLVLETEKVKGLKDLHDRIIIATARIFDAPIISRDKVIKRHYSKTIW